MDWLQNPMQELARLIRPHASDTIGTPRQPGRRNDSVNQNSEGEPLMYYPSQYSIDKGQKGESLLNRRNVAAIAEARRLAESSGILTPELGEHLLPIAMTEGWGQGMGVKSEPKNAFYASRRFNDIINKMGLKPGVDFNDLYIPKKQKDGSMRDELHYEPVVNDTNGPRMAAAILAEKSQLQGVKTYEDAIKRYNGKKPGWEEYQGERIWADPVHYLKKVKEANTALAHPKNAAIRDYYNSVYNK